MDQQRKETPELSDTDCFWKIFAKGNYEFWQMMKGNGGGAIPGELEKKIVEDFGSVDAFKEAFIQAGVTPGIQVL